MKFIRTALIMAGAALLLLAVTFIAGPADAKPALKASAVQYVAIDAVPEVAWPAASSVIFWNDYTTTKLICAADVNGFCAQVSCPNPIMCIAVRMGSLGRNGPDATFRMFGTKRALITVNRDGLLYRPDNYGNVTPWERSVMLTHWVGRAIGLSANPVACLSMMDVKSWQCPPKRPGESYLTPAEILRANAW